MGISKRIVNPGPDRRCRAWVLATLAAAVILFEPPAAWPQPANGSARTAALPPSAVGEDDTLALLPRPLDEKNAERYRKIFRLQARGDWRAADRLVKTLTDRSLLGHVLAQRYLHPTAYRSRFRELRDWLAAYADHPDASRIYRLAVKRMAPGAEPPDRPVISLTGVGTPDNGIEPSTPHWQAGLKAWRQGKFAVAARHFEEVALNDESSAWNRAAGAFWAARSHLKARQPDRVNRWLARAAKDPRTFYGQLARQALGMDSGLDWAVWSLDRTDIEALLRTDHGRRAFGLLQVGEIERAEREFGILAARLEPGSDEALLAVSQVARMPRLALRLGIILQKRLGKAIDAALYPLPGWQPEGGFTVDRALLYALMRQESAFNPDAQSHVGATGLMQLMPQTAGFIAGDGRRFTGWKRFALRDPELNLTLAQKYIEHLLADPNVQGDLLLLVTAYNAGPGNLAKWRRRSAYEDDPLLFIESIPARETRLFIERVLTNLWIYRQRMGQRTPSLEAIAVGARPVYDRQDEVLALTVSDGTN